MREDKQASHNIGKIVGANRHQFDQRPSTESEKSAIQVEEAFQLSLYPFHIAHSKM